MPFSKGVTIAIAICVPTALIATFGIILTAYIHKVRGKRTSELDEAPIRMDEAPIHMEADDFHPGIGVTGQEHVIHGWIRQKGHCEGRSIDKNGNFFETIYNPSPDDDRVHANIFLNTRPNKSNWNKTKKPNIVVNTTSSSEEHELDPFNHLLAIIYNERNRMRNSRGSEELKGVPAEADV
ncbi:uncharacterized protein FMAN_07316 [Fusarium mangiferae]|uniref:Uncharacterized protein n=1 Tax=Fusarium mangiferae TaxID=192010 RepID=A0A1L7T0Y8_FUSMA|nr:uncharacterized protein FMAN_07316 [Fusarium mangiferae]CVK92420.1 uncharacterized protein FMAN_07316 [Fusarium mangiferae]